jgi:hypothetical protein
VTPPRARPASIAVLECDIPGDMTLAEYRRVVDERAGRRRRRRRYVPRRVKIA